MPIPALDANGLLPPGVHEATLTQVRGRFGQFQESDRRPRLQDALEAFAAEAGGSGLVASLIVNGSFATAKARPDDIDMIVVLREGVDLATEFRPDQYNVLSANTVKRRYPFDVRYATSSLETLQPMIEFFAQVRGRPDLRKGMLKVTL